MPSWIRYRSGKFNISIGNAFMANVTTSFLSLEDINETEQTTASMMPLTSAITWAETAYQNIFYGSASYYHTATTNNVSATLTNGDFVSVYGSNLTGGYPRKYTQADYSFTNYDYDVSILGSLSKSSSSAPLAGYLSKITVTNDSGTVTLEGKDVAGTSSGDSISKVTYDSGGVTESFSGKLTLVGQSTVSGNVTSATLTDGTRKVSISGFNIDVKYLRAYDTASEFLSSVMTGNDMASGTSASEYLFGFAGSDALSALAGDDTLVGGAGNDKLTGGKGADKFVFDSLSGLDSISDFKVSEGDKLVFDKTVFTKLINGIAAGNLVISSSTAIAAADDSDYLLFSTKTGKLYYDADGNGSEAAIQIAGIKGTLTGLDYTSFTVA